MPGKWRNLAVLPRRYVWLGAVIILLLAGYVLWSWYFPNYGAGVDEASYLLGARGIARQMDPVYVDPDPELFVPENMIESRPGEFYPTYPIGYPLLAAIGYKFGGPEGAFVVNPVMTLVALVGAFFLARLFLDDLFALVVMLLMGTHPSVLHYGVAAMSHASDLACATWCFYFAWAWYRKPAAYKLALAGALAGYAVSIRYSDALLALPLIYVVVLRFLEARKEGGRVGMRRVAAHAGLGAAMGVVALLPLLWYQAYAFGSPWTTGYSLTGQSRAFSWGNFDSHFPFAIKTLCSIPTGLFVFFPAGIAALFFKRWVPRKAAVFLALASVPTLFLYGAYYWVNREEPLMYVRFFLTMFPVVLIAALLPADVLTRGLAVVRYGIVALLVILASVILANVPDENRVERSAYSDMAATILVQKNLPRDAVIVGNGYMCFSLVYYTDMTVIYPVYFSEAWVHDRLASAEGGAGATIDFNPLRMRRFADAFKGQNQRELYESLRVKLVGYAKAGRTVALVTGKNDPQWFNYLSESFVPQIVAKDEENDLVLVRLVPR